MTATGKQARKKHGTRAAARRAKAHKGRRRTFGKLPVSVVAGNAQAFVLHSIRAAEGGA